MQFRFSRVFKFMAAATAIAATASAGTIIVTEGDTSQYLNATSDSGGFFVVDSAAGGSFSSLSWASGFQLAAAGGPGWTSGNGYSDAGVVLFFDGGLSLGQLQSVSVDALDGDPSLAINLWLDTGGDGKFFAFDAITGKLTGNNNDSYGGHSGPVLTTSSPIYPLGGFLTGPGSPTLADLQAGLVPGITSLTPTALWIGVTHGGPGDSNREAYLSRITIVTAPVSAPDGGATLVLLGLGFTAVAWVRRRM